MGTLMKASLMASLFAFHLLVHKEVKAQYAPFVFFKFALQWPSSLCNDDRGCARPPPEDFTIHGLWANNDTTGSLIHCYNQPFVPIQNSYVLQQLRLLWPNIKRGIDAVFWKYEWERHGVCSLVWYEQDVYFYLAVTLRERFNDLLSGMISNGIVPGRNRQYRLDDIGVVVQTLLTKAPQFYCNRDINRKIQLSEIWICHTPGGTIISCPDLSSDSCNSEYVNFPLV